MALPSFLKKYFWDVKFDKIDTQQSKVFIIERLLEYGDEDAVSFLREHFTSEELAAVLRKSTALSERSASFWSNILNVPREEILCLSKQFRETSGAIWRP